MVSLNERSASVVLLGTGTPNAEPDRSGPALAVLADETPYLFDCGPGIVRRAMAAHEAGHVGLAAPNLERVFVTHLHSDHTAGLADLILTPWVLGRRSPLEVYGPPGIRAMTTHLLAAYAADIAERRDGREGAHPGGWQVNAHEIQPGAFYRDARVTIEAFAVDHGSWDAYGYRLRTANRCVVISGDTAPTDAMIEQSRDCDLLVHEVYSAVGLVGRSSRWREYHTSMHTSTHELGRMAARAQPGLLVVYHQLLWGRTEQELMAEIRERYDGLVSYGKDLGVY